MHERDLSAVFAVKRPSPTERDVLHGKTRLLVRLQCLAAVADLAVKRSAAVRQCLAASAWRGCDFSADAAEAAAAETLDELRRLIADVKGEEQT